MKIIALGALVLAAAGYCITQTPNWKYSVIRHQYLRCVDQYQGMLTAGLDLQMHKTLDFGIRCTLDFEEQMAKNFGTTKASEAPTPIW